MRRTLGRLGANRRLFVAVAVGSFLTLTAATQPQTLEQQFREQAPLAWEKYKARSKRLQGTYSYKLFTMSPQRALVSDTKCELKQKAGRALVLQQSIPTLQNRTEAGELAGSNPDYAFVLHRPSPNNPWLLTEIAKAPNKSLAYFNPAPRVDRTMTYPITFCAVFGEMGIITQEPGYKIAAITESIRAGQRCVEVQFNYAPDGTNPRIPSVKGTAVYNADKYWVVKECKATTHWAERKDYEVAIHVQMEYVETSDGFPILKRVVKQSDSREDGKEHHYELVFDFSLAEGDVPDAAFTLSAYGLPEPKK